MVVNAKIRSEAKRMIIRAGLKQSSVAKDLKMERQYLSDMLNTKKSNLPKRWVQLLTYLEAKIGKEDARKEFPMLNILLEKTNDEKN